MRWLIVFGATLASACGSSGSGGCPTTARTQPNGSPCCPNFTDTACDTGLFCAALDSTTPTCQPLHSRADLTACNDDVQCASGACALIAPPIGECKSRPNMPCQASVGCAPVNGKTPICDGTCHPVGTGTVGSFCNVGKDCRSGSCVMNHCLGDLGEACTSTNMCASGMCMGCGFTNVHCSKSGDAMECLRDCGTDGSGNTIYSRCVQEGGACSSFNDCAGTTLQCSDCSAANNTCMTPGDLNECLRMCTNGTFSYNC